MPPGGPRRQPQTRYQTPEEAFGAKNRKLLLYTSAVVRLYLFSSILLPSIVLNQVTHNLGYIRARRLIRRCPPLSRILRRDRLRWDAKNRHRLALHARTDGPCRKCAKNKGALQRGQVGDSALELRAVAAVR